MFAHFLKRVKIYAENSIHHSKELISLEHLKTRFFTSKIDLPHPETQKHDLRNIIWSDLRAALRGDKEAQYKMGMNYLNGQHGLDRSYSHAEKWLEQAAHQGHQNAKKELQDAYNQLAFS